MDVPFLFAHKKALPALLKSIAASSFNFVLILSLSLADLKSISRAATSNSYSIDLEWVALPETVISINPTMTMVWSHSTSNNRSTFNGDTVIVFLSNFHVHA